MHVAIKRNKRVPESCNTSCGLTEQKKTFSLRPVSVAQEDQSLHKRANKGVNNALGEFGVFAERVLSCGSYSGVLL